MRQSLTFASMAQAVALASAAVIGVGTQPTFAQSPAVSSTGIPLSSQIIAEQGKQITFDRTSTETDQHLLAEIKTLNRKLSKFGTTSQHAAVKPGPNACIYNDSQYSVGARLVTNGVTMTCHAEASMTGRPTPAQWIAGGT